MKPRKIASNALTGRGMMSAPTILLFDEEQLMREATALLLANRGGKVTKAGTLEDAIVYLRQRRYDVAVIDLSDVSPRCVDILQRMRDEGCVPKRVIVCTSAPVPRLDDVEFTDVLVKPYPFDRLLDAVFGRTQPQQRRTARPALFPLVRRVKTMRRTAQVRRHRV
jgi:DNA-binding NtrC family response regulator